MFKSIEDLTEPNTDDETRFNLSIKQLQFIQNESNIKFINNIMKSMKKYKLEIGDVNNIIEQHIQNEQKRMERNETRRLKKQQERNNDSDDEYELRSISSTKMSNKCKRRSERSNSRNR